MTQLVINDVRFDRIIELEGLGYDPDYFFKGFSWEGFEEEKDWLVPHFWDLEQNGYLRSVHAYVVRTAHHTVLVDACVGEAKPRPSTPAWDGLKSGWMDRMKAAGVQPEEIDYVMCTHLHADHVGWNTRLENGRWVPTFPNAKYIFHKDEFNHWNEFEDELEGPGTSDSCFEDSVLPVVQAGQVELVSNDFAVDDQFTIEPTPGHSPGHMCISVDAGGQKVLVTGDVIHHPLQIARPEWNSRFCLDPARSAATRRAFVERHADSGDLILAAHFPTPTAGRIVSNRERWKFQLGPEEI